MILLDSNIIIYLIDSKFTELISSQLVGHRLATSNIVIVEVLGYNSINPKDELYITELFNTMDNLGFDEVVVKKVIEIRKNRNMQLPDAIIAATALVNDTVLWTHNLEDFQGIKGLNLFDPLASPAAQSPIANS